MFPNAGNQQNKALATYLRRGVLMPERPFGLLWVADAGGRLKQGSKQSPPSRVHDDFAPTLRRAQPHWRDQLAPTSAT